MTESNIIGNKLIVVMSQLAQGFGKIATALESGKMSSADAARVIREIEVYATAMVKEMSL